MKHVSQISFDFKWDDEKPYDLKAIENKLLRFVSEIETIYGIDAISMDEEYEEALKCKE